MKKEDILPNKIYFTTDVETILKVVDKTDEMKKSDMLKEDFVKRLATYIFSGTGIVLVSFGENKELNGCLVLTKQRDKRGDYLWIEFAWIDPKYPDMRKLYEEEVMGTARVRGIKRIQCRMSKGFKAMEKLYNTYEIGRILEREVLDYGTTEETRASVAGDTRS